MIIMHTQCYAIAVWPVQERNTKKAITMNAQICVPSVILTLLIVVRLPVLLLLQVRGTAIACSITISITEAYHQIGIMTACVPVLVVAWSRK